MPPCAVNHARSLWYSAYAQRTKSGRSHFSGARAQRGYYGKSYVNYNYVLRAQRHIRYWAKTQILYNFNALTGIYGRFHVEPRKNYVLYGVCVEFWFVFGSSDAHFVRPYRFTSYVNRGALIGCSGTWGKIRELWT